MGYASRKVTNMKKRFIADFKKYLKMGEKLKTNMKRQAYNARNYAQRR